MSSRFGGGRSETANKNVSKSERDIDSSMLEVTRQVFIEEILRYTFCKNQ